jgi:hypothetical protein
MPQTYRTLRVARSDEGVLAVTLGAPVFRSGSADTTWMPHPRRWNSMKVASISVRAVVPE